MKRGVILLLLCSLTWTSMPLHAREIIRLASGEWAPYQSENFRHGGFVSDIVRQAFNVEGIDVEFGYFPWNRSLVLAREGHWDGTFLWFDTPERRSEFHISEPIIDIAYVFFHLKKYPFEWQTIEDLKGVRIGATHGYEFGGDAFRQAEKDGSLQVLRSYEDRKNMQRLFLGRIDVFPCDLQAGYALINTLFTTEESRLFTHHKTPVKAAPHHLLLSKKIKNGRRLVEG